MIARSLVMAAVVPSLGGEGVVAAREVLEAALVEQSVPRPRLADWWQDVVVRVVSFVAGLLNLESATVRLFLMAVTWGVIVLATLMLLWFLWGWWRRQTEPVDATQFERIGAQQAVPGMSASSWQQRLEDALRRSDVSAALEALWFVVAARLWTTRTPSVGGLGDGLAGSSSSWRADREWTGRRLLDAAGDLRERLTPAVLGLERMTYSEGVATLDEIERLLVSVDEVLPPETSRLSGRGSNNPAGRGGKNS